MPELDVWLRVFRYHFHSDCGRVVGGCWCFGCVCSSDADDEGECGDDGCCDASHGLSDLSQVDWVYDLTPRRKGEELFGDQWVRTR